MRHQAISRGMLKVPPINLNRQPESQDATIQLIRDVLQRGIQLSDVYVDPIQTPKRKLGSKNRSRKRLGSLLRCGSHGLPSKLSLKKSAHPIKMGKMLSSWRSAVVKAA
ncbi:hypothetical protein JVU11DRAFT_9073 [Chiua virens]|nr:hypothetical protein JVU11DRAFT_9073 [Chiua virens]